MKPLPEAGYYPGKFKRWATYYGIRRAVLVALSGVSPVTVSRAFRNACSWESANELSKATLALRPDDPMTALQIVGREDWRPRDGIAPAK